MATILVSALAPSGQAISHTVSPANANLLTNETGIAPSPSSTHREPSRFFPGKDSRIGGANESFRLANSYTVIAGLDPAIHAEPSRRMTFRKVSFAETPHGCAGQA